jgi:alkanesulfonate monooxygenase
LSSRNPAFEIIGMIGVKREAESSAGAALSVIGGGNDPTGAIPSGVDGAYIADFTRVHEQSGFDSVLIGYASSTADGFAVAMHAAAQTERIGFVIAHRPGFVAPTLAARMLATIDQLTSGRIAVHVISGGSDAEQRKDGDWIDHDARYRRTGEYLDVMKLGWTSARPFDYAGEFYQVEGGYSDVRCLQQPHLPVFFGGASDAALEAGARHADVYAFWGEPLASIRAQIADISKRAAAYGRSPRFSVSVRPILGRTEGEAWDRARRILSSIEGAVGGSVERGQSARPQSVGSRRLIDFAMKGEVYDKRLWTPIAAASGAPGSSTALVGTAEQVAESILDYYDAGCSATIIRGFDPYNDAIDYGRELVPMIRQGIAARTGRPPHPQIS